MLSPASLSIALPLSPQLIALLVALVIVCLILVIGIHAEVL